MDRDYTIYENWKNYLGPLGMKKARLQAGWAKVERAPGVYHWDWLDRIVFDMAAQGVEPWMCLCYGNSLYSPGGIRLGAALPADEKALRAWDRWVRGVVARYGEVIDEWEVWNEPNNKKNSPELYSRFFIRTATQIRSVQRKSKILAIAQAGVDARWADRFLAAVSREGRLDLIDQVTYHPYSRNPDASYPAVERYRKTVARYSDRITIRQGENGCPSERRRTKALSGYPWTEVSQSKWALRRLLGDLGRDIPSSYFAIMDMKYPDEMNRKGLLKSREDQTVEYAKPAYHALQNLAAVFDHQLDRISNFRYQAATGRSLSVFAYRHGEKDGMVITIWFDGDVPSDSLEKTEMEITLEKTAFADPVYVDLRTGKVYQIPGQVIEQKESRCRLKQLPCYDCPVLVAERSVIPLK